MNNSVIENVVRRVLARFELIGFDNSELTYDLTGFNAENARVKPYLSAIDASTPIIATGTGHSVRIRCIVRNALGKPVVAPVAIYAGDGTAVVASATAAVGTMQLAIIGTNGVTAWVTPDANGAIDVSITFDVNPAEPNPVVIDTGMKRFMASATIN